MKMNSRDADLYYDGRIPPGVVDDTLPSYFAPPRRANAVRVVNVREKPASIMTRMARWMEALSLGGCLTEGDLKRGGFTDAEIAAHAQDAFRLMLVSNPTLVTMEYAA